MTQPIVPENYFKEREGVLRVALELNNYGYVFRETPNADIGIDGQIEKVSTTKEVPGKLAGAQIKSGNSHLIDKGDHFAFYPKEKHKKYWSAFPLPVILFVHYPIDGRIYFTDVRYQLNIPNKVYNYVKLDKQSFLNSENAHKIFETVDTTAESLHSIKQVLRIMLHNECPNPTFKISYLDLFTQGLTNLCRHLYFSMDLAMQIAEFNNDTEFGLGMGYEEYQFLHSYATFLISQNLADINYSDYLIDWKERELVPTFITPLTLRGRELLEHIKTIENRYENQLPPTTLVRERYIEMKFYSADDHMRLKFGQVFKQIVLENIDL